MRKQLPKVPKLKISWIMNNPLFYEGLHAESIDDQIGLDLDIIGH